MNEMLRKTREWLNCSTRRSFSAVIHEAKITPRQMQVCELKFVKGLTNYQIAAELNVSDKTIEKELNRAYKSITNVLKSLQSAAPKQGGFLLAKNRESIGNIKGTFFLRCLIIKS